MERSPSAIRKSAGIIGQLFKYPSGNTKKKNAENDCVVDNKIFAMQQELLSYGLTQFERKITAQLRHESGKVERRPGLST